MSPHILQHSGIGSGEHLRSLGIPVVSDLPAVGKNLQDHVFGHLKYRLTRDEHSLNADVADPARLQESLKTWREHGTGPLNTTTAQVLGFFRSDDTRPAPDIQIAMRPFSASLGETGIPEADHFPGMMASAINTQPYSRGEVTITSDDPAQRARIDAGYLTDKRDVDVLILGMRRVREIMTQLRFRIAWTQSSNLAPMSKTTTSLRSICAPHWRPSTIP